MYDTKGTAHGMAILNEESVIKIREMKNSHTQQELANMFGVGRRTIGQIVNRKLWKHI